MLYFRPTSSTAGLSTPAPPKTQEFNVYNIAVTTVPLRTSAPLHSSLTVLTGCSPGSTWLLTLVSLREFQITFKQILETLGVGDKDSELDSIYKMRHKKKENGKQPYWEVFINSRKIHTKKKGVQPKTWNLLRLVKVNFQSPFLSM